MLDWPGYRVYQHAINGEAKTLKLWERREPGNRKVVRSGCGRRVGEIHEVAGIRAVVARRPLPHHRAYGFAQSGKGRAWARKCACATCHAGQ